MDDKRGGLGSLVAASLTFDTRVAGSGWLRALRAHSLFVLC